MDVGGGDGEAEQAGIGSTIWIKSHPGIVDISTIPG